MSSLQDLRYRLRGEVERWFEVPAAATLTRLGVSATGATLIGLALTGVATYWVINGRFLIAGLVALAAALFDLVDGAIARRTGTVSDRGALLDSVADRAAESSILIGLVIYYSSVPALNRPAIILAAVALAGSLMVSYVRARAEGLGYRGTGGFLTRPERVVILTPGLLAMHPIPSLWIIAIGTPLSALHRFYVEWRAAGPPSE